jgi:hypothetical protein
MSTYENNYTTSNQNKGMIALNEFVRIMTSNHRHDLIIPIKEHSFIDTNYHIDCIICRVDGGCDTYDVKNNLTQYRGGQKCFVVELRNNAGNQGSAFGMQRYFAVMDKDSRHAEKTNRFWKYSRTEMLAFLESKVGDLDEFLKSKMGDDKDADELTPYKKYTRSHEGKRDICVLVPLEDCNFITEIK